MGIIIIVIAVSIPFISYFTIRHMVRTEEKNTFKVWEHEANSFIKLNGKD